jgi:PilZ domain
MASPSKQLWQTFSRFFKRGGGKKPRAPRIQIECPLRFRPVGQAEWFPAVMFNVSRSGVVFRADRILGVQTSVEMTFTIPPEIARKEGALVNCRGEVVRTVTPATDDARPLLAVTILEYLPGTEWKPEI